MNNQITNDFDIMELIKALMSMKQQQQPQINPSGMLASLNQSPTQPSPTGMLNALAGSTAAGQASYQPKRTTPQDQSNWERFTKGGGGGGSSSGSSSGGSNGSSGSSSGSNMGGLIQLILSLLSK